MYDNDRKLWKTRIGIIVILKILKVKHVLKTIYVYWKSFLQFMAATKQTQNHEVVNVCKRCE